MKDLHHNIDARTVLAPVTVDSDTTTAGEVIDLQGFESVEFILTAGALADGVFALELAAADAVDENGDLVDEVAVTSADELLGSLPSVQNDDEDESGVSKRVGYRGEKRYVRADVASTETDAGGIVGVVAVLGDARNNPVA